MAKRLTIMNIPGDADQLFELKHEVMDPVMQRKAPEYGGMVHIAAKNADGSGIIIVNLWESEDGSDNVVQDPEVQEARRKMMEAVGAQPEVSHHEVVDVGGRAVQPA